ncbi:MAG: hypothetical protein K9J79_04500 [Desulfobacteraceae bacterium]|nr:hypothetical protein [Desulfobacteraceae bacterium]MCF8094601.1 hypothetical protein [Desulfobacteraceae bacterium]
MKTVKWMGILAFLAGVVFFGFHAIGILMGRPEGFYSKSLNGFLGAKSMEWIEGLPFEPLRAGADFIVHSPLYVILIGVGFLLLVINGLFAKS